jgi:hypothetical protein
MSTLKYATTRSWFSYLILFLFLVAAVVNVFFYFRTGHDVDRIVIAVLFLSLFRYEKRCA